MKKPPKKLSTLMKLALKDLAKVERNKKYKVDMGAAWHYPGWDKEGVCTVCLGGAVMAGTCNADITLKLDPEEMEGWCQHLKALDRIRNGGVASALDDLDIPCPTSIAPFHNVCSYEDNPEMWKNDMREIIKVLEEHKL